MKRTDYIRALFGGADDEAFGYPTTAKRILRKLVRRAVALGILKWSLNNTLSGNDVADAIAKELIP